MIWFATVDAVVLYDQMGSSVVGLSVDLDPPELLRPDPFARKHKKKTARQLDRK